MSTFYFKKIQIRRYRTISKYAYIPQQKPVKKESNLVNEAIKFPKVMLIDSDGKSLGIIDTKKALDLAYNKDLDLVCVAPQAEVPVCKILDYPKYRYDKEKAQKEAQKNQKVIETKEIQLSPTIAENDFNTKLNQGRKFLSHGDKVKVTLRIKRRFISLSDRALEIVNDYVAKCMDIGQTDKKPDFDGKVIMITISPRKQTTKKENKKESVKEDSENNQENN